MVLLLALSLRPGPVHTQQRPHNKTNNATMNPNANNNNNNTHGSTNT